MPAPSPAAAPARRATSYDVAREAGVAQSTVSRCFRADGTISAATRSLVLEAAERLGYVPNALARSLITRRSDLIGVVMTGYTLRGNPEVMYAIGDALRTAGKQILLVVTRGDEPDEAELRRLLEYPLEGLICCVTMRARDVVAAQGRGVAVVLLNRRLPRLSVDGVATDHAVAAGGVAAALHAAGHRRLLVVSGPDSAPVGRERVRGFLDRLRRLGAAPPAVVATDYSYEGGRDGLLAHVAAAGALPEAVFCTSDQTAMGVMDACRFTLGARIPDDVSVVGFDDVADAARPGYRLTTVRQDAAAMARRTVQLLLRRLEEPHLPTTTEEVASCLVVRDSARLDAPGDGGPGATRGRAPRRRG